MTRTAHDRVGVRMSMYTPPSEQHETGVEGGEFVDVEPQDADAARIDKAVREADMTNGEPNATVEPDPSNEASDGSAP